MVLFNIEHMENQIIDRLQSLITDLRIEGFPENPSEYPLVHSNGAILVHYQGSEFLPTKAGNEIIQTCKIRFGITVVIKHLRTHTGAYHYLDAIREYLTGYQSPGYTKLYPIREEFISEQNGIWQYRMEFGMTMPTSEHS